MPELGLEFTRRPGDPTVKAWRALDGVVVQLRAETANDPRLANAHEAVERLARWLGAVEAAGADAGPLDRAVRTGQVPGALRGPFIATVVAARGLVRDCAAPDAELPPAVVAKLRETATRLVDAMCGPAPVSGAMVDEPLAPAWLDVASPAHGQVNVRGLRTLYRAGHVRASDSTTVVAADNCTLEAEDHYEVHRLSLDCSSLYGDPRTMESLAEVLIDPSRQAVATFRRRLSSVVGPAPEEGRRLHRERVSHGVATTIDRADVVGLGDGSTAHVTTRYHVEETVVPLADLLHEHPDLITELAGSFRPGAPPGADPPAAILDRIGQLDELSMLRNATGLDSGDASVRGWFGTTRVDLASAVMVGYGNELTRSATVDVGRTVHSDLAVFDAAIARIHDRAAASRNDRPER